MTPRIYDLSDEETYKSLYVTDRDLQLSSVALSTPEQFLEARTSSRAHQIIVPLQDIERITYMQDDSDVTIDFPNDPGGQGGETMEFDRQEDAEEFIRTLSSHLNLNKTEEDEDLYSALYSTAPLFIGALAIFIATFFIEEEDVMGRRGRKGAAIARLIYGTLGATGVTVLAGIIAAGLGYLVYERVTHRNTVYTYSR